MEKLIAIGDIHGCLKQLKEVMSKISVYPDHKIIFLGDYIDRGPESNELVDYIKNIPAVFILGNHETMLFDLIELMDPDDMKSFLANKNFSYDNYLWLKKNCLLFFETENYFFSHAGLNENKSMAKQDEYDFLWSLDLSDYKKITDKKVIHGHRSVNEVLFNGNNIDVDTGCGKNGYLSSLVIPEMIVVKSDTPGQNFLKLDDLENAFSEI